MAWLKPGQGPAGLPPFAPRPPPVAPPFCSSGRAGSMSSEGALPSHYSTDTQPSSLEEEELSRELTMELLGDFALEEQRSRRGSAHPSRKPSSGPTTSDGAAAGGAAADSQAAAGGQQEGQAGGDLDDEAEPMPEALQPSLYDQLGGGVAVKAVVDRFYSRVLGDPQLGRFFQGVDMTKHTRKFLLFVTYVLGGPDEYLQLNPQPWPALYNVHEELMRKYGLCETHFDVVKAHFGEAMQDAGASQRLVDMALGVVETTRRIMFPAGGAHEQAVAELEAAKAAAKTGSRPAEY